MKNITVLNRFPTEVYNSLIMLYQDFYVHKDPETRLTDMHWVTKISRDTVNSIFLNFPLKIESLEIYYVKPFNKRMIPHIDRGRKTALQIPIDINYEKSYTFSFNGRDVSKLEPDTSISFPWKNKEIVNVSDYYFFKWNDLLFDTYNLQLPILQNAAMPHGGSNFSNTTRIFYSMSLLDDYDSAVTSLSDWI
jgi:hypothetical protein